MTTDGHETVRVDRWLWSVRIYKTRSSATAACRAGSVSIAGLTAKPAREVRVGDKVIVKLGLVERTLVVLGYPPQRVGAKVVALYCDDRTPPEELAKAQQDRLAQFLAREKGSGRPTKRDRRSLDDIFRS